MIQNDDKQKIRDLFGEINTPAYDILEGVQSQMKQKTKRPSKTVAIALAVCAMFMLTTVAVVAAYQSTGGFARLRGIVGDEIADEMTAIEVDGVLDVPYLPGDIPNPSNDRFAIELVAISGEVGGIMHFYFTLEDLTGVRKNDIFYGLTFALHTSDYNRPYVTGHASEIIHTEGSITTVRGQTHGMAQREGGGFSFIDFDGYVPDFVLRDGEIKFTVLNVEFNVAYNYVDNQGPLLDLSLVQELPEDEIMTLTIADFDADYPLGWFTPEDTELLNTTGLRVPRIGLHNHEIDMPRVSLQIASIGIIGDSLYILTYEPFAHYSRWSGLRLISPEGRDILPCKSLMFNICPDGLLYFGQYRRESAIEIYNIGMFSRNSYLLIVFEGIDLSRLNEFTLAGTFVAGDSVWLDWTDTFVYTGR